MQTVAVIGLGYVGLPLVIEFGKHSRTIGFDIVEAKVDSCRRGVDPSREIPDEEMRAAVHAEYSADPKVLAEADIIIVAVPTPVDEAHIPDFKPLIGASKSAGAGMKKGAIVVYESTVYPGATEEVCIPVLEQASGLKWKQDFFVGYSPERINPGDREHMLTNVIKVVSGDTPETLEKVAAMYERIVQPGVHRCSSIKAAEACKVIENTQRDLNIALMNELAIIFDKVGIDTSEVLKAAGTKWNFLRFSPGLVGGHCIGVDPYYLTHKAEMLGYHPQVILAGRRINDGMGKYIAARFGIGSAKHPPVAALDSFGTSFVHQPQGAAEAAEIVAAADEIIAGRWSVFAMDAAPLGFPPQWNCDPKTGKVAPLVPGKSIDYRRESIVGDIKYLWEPARHLELVTLALAWRASGNPTYLNASRSLLDSWFEQCPYPLGVHWTSSLELAVRLVNWAFAWHLLGGSDSPLFSDAGGEAFRDRWLASVYQHCHFIAGYFSRHSSANNHLFGEYMGLFVASLNWPCWKESARWKAMALTGLEDEAVRQNFADGVNKEQAVYYQHEVMDMMLICHLVADANGTSFSPAFMQRLERMAEFVHSLMDVKGNVPMIGDADDAEMVRLAYAPGWNRYRSLLCSCALLFGRPDFKAKAGSFDAKNACLFGEVGRQKWGTLEAGTVDTPRRDFPAGGYRVLGDHFGKPDELRAVIDAAPLGYLSIAAHGHADALSLMLSVGGEPFLIDPGTFAYHTQKKWRDYFRGTSAHNTVRVDGLDQSVIAGNFMWLDKANAACEQWSSDADRDVFVGSHDGYTRLSDPVMHRRTVQFDKATRIFTVTDALSCRAVHEVELFWHFAPTCTATLLGTQATIRRNEQELAIEFSGDDTIVDLVHGDEMTPLGWYSETFDSKEPCTVIRQCARIKGSATFVSRISILS